MSINLNGYQLSLLLDLTWPDKGNEKENEQSETEICLVIKNEEFVSEDGDLMPSGLYMYYAEYQEEGLSYIPTSDKETSNDN